MTRTTRTLGIGRGGTAAVAEVRGHVDLDGMCPGMRLASLLMGTLIVEIFTFTRQGLARLAWHAELGCLLLTLLYSALALSDVYLSNGPHYSSPAWFEEGFCLWESASVPGINSHTLSFASDLVLGTVLVAVNLALHSREESESPRKDALLIAAVISVFDVLHGLGHLSIHAFPHWTMDSRPPVLSASWMAQYAVAFVFLGVTPVLGNAFGVPAHVCVAIHGLQTFLFVRVPRQFAFGAVQLLLNLWFCLPRLLWLGTSSNAHISLRVDNGWLVASVGNLLLMPVVFAELLLCETHYRPLLGHWLYDTSTVFLTIAFSVAVWREAPASSAEKGAIAALRPLRSKNVGKIGRTRSPLPKGRTQSLLPKGGSRRSSRG